MPLTLITGRANSGKTEFAYRALSAKAPARAALLLPTGPDVTRARRDIAPRRPQGVGVWRFDRYLAEAWDLAGDGRRLVGDVQRATLCDLVSRRASEPSTSTPGFAMAMATYVRRLADAGRFADSPAGVKVGQASWMTELAASYAQALGERGLIEPGTAFALLPSDPFPNETLVAHRFTELTASQESFLLARARDGTDVHVTLTWDPESPATHASSRLAERLLEAADEHIVAEPSERVFGADELIRLERGLFARPSPHPPTGALTLLEAHGEDAEAQGIAEQVERWLDEGFSGQEIAILYRDPVRHMPALTRALDEAGIPIDVDVRAPVLETPLGRSIGRLLAFALGLGARDLAAFLRSPFSGATPDAADDLEARWRRGRITHGRKLLAGLDTAGPETLGVVLDALALAARPLTQEATQGWAALLGRMLGAAHGRDAPHLDSSSGSDAAVHRAVLGAVSQLAALDLDAPAGQVLREALSWIQSQPATLERPGRVQVMPVERARSRRFTAVVLGGLTADEFPQARGVAREDAVAAALSAAGVDTGLEEGLDAERLLYYLGVTRARERLALSRQVSDGEGRSRRPSPFWEETLDLYREPIEGPTGEPTGRAVPAELPVRRVFLFEELGPMAEGSVTGRQALRALAAGRCEAPDGWTGNQAARTAMQRAAAATTRRTGLCEESLGELAVRDTISASEIESYVRCPFQWFYERAVAPRRLDAEFGHLERGSLAHHVLQQVYERLPGHTGEPRITPGTLGSALALVDAVLAEPAEAAQPARTLDEEDGLRTVRTRVRALLTADASLFTGFAPIGLEWSFGPDEATGLQLEGVHVRGRVDRIDSTDQAILVMDYKTGKTVGHYAFEREGLVQLTLYAEAARSAFDLPLAGGLYRSLKDGGNRGFLVKGAVEEPGLAAGGSVVESGELSGIVAEGLERAAAAIRGMRAGSVAARPANANICTYCAASDACGGPR